VLEQLGAACSHGFRVGLSSETSDETVDGFLAELPRLVAELREFEGR